MPQPMNMESLPPSAPLPEPGEEAAGEVSPSALQEAFQKLAAQTAARDALDDPAVVAAALQARREEEARGFDGAPEA